jgi:hypothetical protein
MSITLGILIFEISIVLISGLLLITMQKSNPKILRRYFIIIIGVLIFEIFTNSLWHNNNLGSITYIYRDVSWIITLGWAIILLFSIEITDYLYKAKKEHIRFFIYLIFSVILGVFGETLVHILGIRSYSPEAILILSGINIPFTPVPIEAIYYMTTFMALIIGFAKYFELCFDKETIVTSKKRQK